jgi:hypothetical protein
MIDHFLKIDRDNKKCHGFTGRAYRNVPLNGVIRFHFSVLVTKKSEIANLHFHIYVQISNNSLEQVVVP